VKSADIVVYAGAAIFGFVVADWICNAVTPASIQQNKLRTLHYDGHQYLSYRIGYMDGICHLESCTNSVHLK